MTRLALLVLALPACFVAPINQRPSASIRQQTPGTALRGSLLTLDAEVDDPDYDAVSVAWHAYACTTGVDPQPDCDPTPFAASDQVEFTVTVPVARVDGTPVRAVRVLLDAEDDRGAVARPEQELVVPVGDIPPTLTTRAVSAHDFVIGSHIQLFADVADADDGATGVTLDWHVFTPTVDATFALVDEPPPTAAPGHRGEAKALVAQATGSWDVRVTALDAVGQSTVADFALVIGDDEPPCEVGASPIAQAGATLPLFEPTEFAIPVVTDDLDTYPPLVGDVDAGAATFAWSLAVNGGARAPLAATGNRVALDPASYHPGDILELRVEVSDRIDRTASFAACGDAATCTFNPVDATCAQRQTWRVEVR